MAIKEIVAIVIGVAILLGVPIAMIWGVVDHIRNSHKRERRNTGATAGIGAAMQELDRLVARPSVEHVVEAETQTLRREDDQGGE
jgi:hypothetical protein